MKAHYTNDEITDNNWNTVWFYQKPISGSQQQTRLTMRKGTRTWNEVLNGYLREIGYYKD